MVSSDKACEPCARCVSGPQAWASTGKRTTASTVATKRSMASNRTMASEGAQGDLRRVAQGLRAYVEYLRTTGVDGLPRTQPAAATSPPAQAAPRVPAAPPGEAVKTSPPPAPAAPPAQGSPGHASLEALRVHIGDCTRCKLSGGRTNLVFGVGNPNADLMF